MGRGRTTTSPHQPGGFPRRCNICGSGTSIQKHTRQSEVTSECSAIDCCHNGGIGSRWASNRCEVEEWLKALKRKEGLANPTLDKIRRVMSLVYRHSQRYGLIPRNQESNPMRFVRCKTTSEYEAMILTPEQAYTVLLNLQEPERTLTLLAAGTGLRVPRAAMARREFC